MSSMATQEERAMADAAAWLARLQRDDVTERDGLDFEAWLAAAPAHAAAYRRTLAMWHEFEGCADDVLTELTTQARHETLRRAPTRRGWLIGAGGAALAATLAVAVVPGLVTEPPAETFATGKGERRKITLDDGSVIDLNAETSLSVRLTRSAREVTLADGQAIFDVTHDPGRPFTVAASGRLVRVVGTRFDVRSRHGELAVTVAGGKVRVTPATSAASGRAFLLTPGQRLEVDRAGVEQLRAVDPEEALGWRIGRLVYRAEPLANVVADLNRQFEHQIEISDPELGRMPITGVIVVDDQAAVMARLTLMLPVRSVPSERGLLLLRK
ncbi:MULTISPECIES: FecR family protein [unclassified Phenylobacterium]|uniref:FecR family protein n=1 Tax=unclassified Phenylobacterium TaxID=2640670 RepID=UPI00083A7817|nr:MULTISPECIES: FecR domain-containing protein [unclassified Phenylobacterium]